jgi:hypothetical protein
VTADWRRRRCTGLQRRLGALQASQTLHSALLASAGGEVGASRFASERLEPWLGSLGPCCFSEQAKETSESLQPGSSSRAGVGPSTAGGAGRPRCDSCCGRCFGSVWPPGIPTCDPTPLRHRCSSPVRLAARTASLCDSLSLLVVSAAAGAAACTWRAVLQRVRRNALLVRRGPSSAAAAAAAQQAACAGNASCRASSLPGCVHCCIVNWLITAEPAVPLR